MSEINYRAVRAYNRLASKLATSHAEASSYDAGFDGGEWSGPWHAESLERESNRLIAKVALRFGMSPRVLANQQYIAAMDESDKLVAALSAGHRWKKACDYVIGSVGDETAEQVYASLKVGDLVAEILSGKEWNSETCQHIAEVLRAAGYTVEELS